MPKAIRDTETGALVFHMTPEEKSIQDLQLKFEDMERKLEKLESKDSEQGGED